jgi:hypothetical protein
MVGIVLLSSMHQWENFGPEIEVRKRVPVRMSFRGNLRDTEHRSTVVPSCFSESITEDAVCRGVNACVVFFSFLLLL